MSKIYVQNLTKKYGPVTALDNVSLEIDTGEFLVLLGPSGCSKTTLLRCLAGLEVPDEGKIVMGDSIVFSSKENIMVPPGKRNLGMVFQSYALWPHMNVRDNVKFGLEVLKTPKTVAEKRLDEVLNDVGLNHLDQRYPAELSGGQQQRVALARLLATQPPIFLMDEPLSNLDARLRMDMRVELKRFQSAAKATTVYVTHDQTEAMTMSTRVVVMKDGAIISNTGHYDCEINIEDLAERSQSVRTIRAENQEYTLKDGRKVHLLAEGRLINLVELTSEKSQGNIFTNEDIQVDIGWAPDCSNIVIGARPEDILISHDNNPGTQQYEITAVLPNGPEIIVQLNRGRTNLITRVPYNSTFFEGQKVWAHFNKSALNIYSAASRSLIYQDTAKHTAAL